MVVLWSIEGIALQLPEWPAVLVKPGCHHSPQPPPLPPQLPACDQKEHEGAHIENKETREIIKGTKFRTTISKVNWGKCTNWIENKFGSIGEDFLKGDFSFLRSVTGCTKQSTTTWTLNQKKPKSASIKNIFMYFVQCVKGEKGRIIVFLRQFLPTERHESYLKEYNKICGLLDTSVGYLFMPGNYFICLKTSMVFYYIRTRMLEAIHQFWSVTIINSFWEGSNIWKLDMVRFQVPF